MASQTAVDELIAAAKDAAAVMHGDRKVGERYLDYFAVKLRLTAAIEGCSESAALDDLYKYNSGAGCG